jgi:ABC-type phosphate/phosphonate transport system permease subunit
MSSPLGIIALRLGFLSERQAFNEAVPRAISMIEKRTLNLIRD